MKEMQFGDLVLTPFQQKLCKEQVSDIVAVTKRSVVDKGLFANVKPGDTVCIGVPSRGISCMKQVVIGVLEELHQIGATPFIVPAMGSHGGGTADGQRDVLTGYGISNVALGVSVKSSTDAVHVSDTTVNGKHVPVFWDRHALEADHVVVINRIKEHTAFTGPVESGLMKILAVGLGKPEGAKAIHQAGVKETITPLAKWLMERFPVLGGIAIVENGLHQPMVIEAVSAKDIPVREPELLEKARAVLPRIPFDELDVLIIGEMGKDISGTGMDTNVIGKYRRNWGVPSPSYKRIVVLDLTDASHSNATGVGFADIITQLLYDKIDLDATRLNCMTAGNFNGAKIPVTAKDAEQAVEWAMEGLEEDARVVYVNSTLDLETIWVSESLRSST